jgi:hypothetical protein
MREIDRKLAVVMDVVVGHEPHDVALGNFAELLGTDHEHQVRRVRSRFRLLPACHWSVTQAHPRPDLSGL